MSQPSINKYFSSFPMGIPTTFHVEIETDSLRSDLPPYPQFVLLKNTQYIEVCLKWEGWVPLFKGNPTEYAQLRKYINQNTLDDQLVGHGTLHVMTQQQDPTATRCTSRHFTKGHEQNNRSKVAKVCTHNIHVTKAGPSSHSSATPTSTATTLPQTC